MREWIVILKYGSVKSHDLLLRLTHNLLYCCFRWLFYFYFFWSFGISFYLNEFLNVWWVWYESDCLDLLFLLLYVF
jgi:hypothetical protein